MAKKQQTNNISADVGTGKVYTFGEDIGLILWGVLAVAAFLWGAVMHNVNGDEREHMTCAYMIFQGLVPYRDFFEHHHPLSWYLFAPVLSIFHSSENIHYIMRAFMLPVVAGTAYYIYRTGVILGLKARAALVGVVVWLSLEIVQTYGSEYRPDNFMVFFQTAGVAYFFEYLQAKRLKYLRWSFGLFIIGFLCLQKAIFLFAPLTLIGLWLLYQKQICWSDVLRAAAVPAVLMIICGLGLYRMGMLQMYWELNWLLNLHIGNMDYLHADFFYVFWLGAVAAGGLIIKSRQLYVRLFCVLYLLLVSEMFIHKPWFGQYLLLYYPCLAVVLALAYNSLGALKYRPVVLYVAVGVLVYNTALLVDRNLHSHLRIDTLKKFTAAILANSKVDDLILGDAGDFTGGLRAPASGYYWFSYTHMAGMDNHFFKRYDLPDYGAVMKTKRPKIIANDFLRNCLLGENVPFDLSCKRWQNMDYGYLNAHYDDMGFVYVRKD